MCLDTCTHRYADIQTCVHAQFYTFKDVLSAHSVNNITQYLVQCALLIYRYTRLHSISINASCCQLYRTGFKHKSTRTLQLQEVPLLASLDDLKRNKRKVTERIA